MRQVPNLHLHLRFLKGGWLGLLGLADDEVHVELELVREVLPEVSQGLLELLDALQLFVDFKTDVPVLLTEVKQAHAVIELSCVVLKDVFLAELLEVRKCYSRIIVL